MKKAGCVLHVVVGSVMFAGTFIAEVVGVSGADTIIVYDATEGRVWLAANGRNGY